MNFNIFSKTFDIGNGENVTIETGKLARQADGSVVVKCGNTMVLATVVAAKEAKPGQGFFPLSVDYQEKFASSGRIPGSFQRRETRLTDPEILVSRLVDRAIRPLFPEGFLNETQILISVISQDPEIPGENIAGLAASAALAVSDIPFLEPISEVRVCKIDGEYIVNPKNSDALRATLDIMLGATEENILMVEGEGLEVQEEELIEAILAGHKAIKIHCQMQRALTQEIGVVKREFVAESLPEDLENRVAAACEAGITKVAQSALSKQDRKAQLTAVKNAFLDSLSEEEKETFDYKSFEEIYSNLEWSTIRNVVLKDRVRLDGRQLDEIRPLAMEIDYLPSPHGSSLFTRGETQSLTTVTLGSKQDEQLVDKAAGVEYKKFMLHYNFPPFCTGEVKPQRGPSRREVGHANLAWRSLKNMLPPNGENPYTIRVVSDILESNGSSSMATVCAGSLALMDAGLQVKKHVSGIAMGMISKGSDYAILSDILGDEDHLGDMDFKVTGTREGITGCQMDIKVDGLSMDVLREALEQAKRGRMHILNHMYACIDAPRPELKPHTPRAHVMEIPKEFIGAVIGPGGKIIQGMQEETNTEITIEEIKELGIGRIIILSNNKDNMEKAIRKIKGIVAVPEVGEVYDAEVKSIVAFGAFVEFMPGKQGLLHISEISHSRLETMEGVLKEGQQIQVKLIGTDPKTGKFKLSHKVLIPKPERKKPEGE
ncbi:MAG: polyribonucleotide nucleotidyltransferase [Chitinophagales bacterium]|nr:polyribonucleotide nucleotidyltransferase [Chitinophagales bacterium]MCZ2393707.1 polyribonucleotide nucleotidyltransferase [Chitinophagales bacterium]